MALAPGTRLGVYDVLTLIGSGGMGEVYRARDTKLDRDVAIKVLPESLAADPDRIARLSREAKTLAALNHPHIAHIHGFEDSTGTPALVMELVEGPTLADRIAQGSIPVDEALAIAKQIAEALEAAHEQGIVHRDLKPANIKLRDDGAVKLLDFGLAKAFESGPAGAASATMSPTLSMHATQAGLILGTAAYMSPEQAAGRAVDKRSDLWAFGVVLFEMLTGRQLFSGETVSHVLASVLKDEPDWTTLPVGTPASVTILLRRCLNKNRKRRLDSAAAARLEIDEASTTAQAAARVAPSRAVPVAAAGAAACAILAATATWVATRSAPPHLQPVRFAIVPPVAQPLAIVGGDRDLAISPDGTHLVYVAGSGSGGTQLMVRAIDQLEAVPLRGTSGARGPVISPDGKWVGFFTSNEFRKVSMTGGPATRICVIPGGQRGASWGADGTIVFATADSATGLLSVSEAGGEPKILTNADRAHGEVDHQFPSLLPDGRDVLFTILTAGPVDNSQVAVMDLKSGTRKTLVRGGFFAQYVEPVPSTSTGPSLSGEPGYIVYATAGALRAIRFDPRRLEVLGDSIPIVDQVMTGANGAAEFSVSKQGTLLYVPGGAGAGVARSLAWVDRQGHEERITTAPQHAYMYPRLSPDGRQVALDIRDANSDIWILHLEPGTLTRLTDDPAADWYPVWTSDGQRIVFASGRSGNLNLFWQRADNTGTVERLTTSQNAQFPTAMSRAGLVFTENSAKNGRDVQLLRMDASTPAQTSNGQGIAPLVTPLVHSTFNEDNGEVSPDGRWLAYQVDDAEQNQIHVRPFPNTDAGHWQVSANGGIKPLWSRDGKELFFLDRSNAMIAVQVQTSPTFRVGNATKLFDALPYFLSGNGRTYDVSLDGKRFLMVKATGPLDQNTTPASMIVVLNWLEELKARVPTK
jgi:eukaryotic-like serine/threonine-protein kinase